MFRAFRDPIRLRALQLLREGKMCVGDQVLGVPQPTASRQMHVLRQVRHVVVRKSGRRRFDPLAPRKSIFHGRLLDCPLSCFQEIPEPQEDAVRAGRLR